MLAPHKMISPNSPSIDPTAKLQNRIQRRNRIYSAKLFDALRRMRRTGSPAKQNGRSIWEAANRALAAAAGGRTRWSKAILAGRSSRRRNRRVRFVGGGDRRKRVLGVGRKGGSVPAVERKVKILRRLIPGCRKLSLPGLLEEVSDYIPALEMQIRVMSSVAEKLSGFAGVLGENRPPDLESESLISS